MKHIGSDIMIDYVINYSLENHRAIDIIYMKGMEITKRRIKVIKIDGDIIKAIDLRKGQIRSFKKSFILSAMNTSSLMRKDMNTIIRKQETDNNIQ